MAVISHIVTDTARFNPEAQFDTPLDLATCKGLTLGQKLATLDRWRRIVLDRLDATAEGMPDRGTTPAELALLEGIEHARARLDDASEPSTPPLPEPRIP